MISLITGGFGNGAQGPALALSRPAHFFHIAGSASSLMKTPPTTDRAWKPTSVPSWFQYQSVIGTREGDAWRKS